MSLYFMSVMHLSSSRLKDFILLIHSWFSLLICRPLPFVPLPFLISSLSPGLPLFYLLFLLSRLTKLNQLTLAIDPPKMSHPGEQAIGVK